MNDGLLDIGSRGMQVQRTVLDLAARNVAAAQASTPDHPYARLVAHFAADPPDLDDAGDAAFGAIPDDAGDAGSADALGGMRVTREPGSGDSLTEMIAVLDAQRAYEANASIFDVGKRLAERTIDVGRS